MALYWAVDRICTLITIWIFMVCLFVRYAVTIMYVLYTLKPLATFRPTLLPYLDNTHRPILVILDKKRWQRPSALHNPHDCINNSRDEWQCEKFSYPL